MSGSASPREGGGRPTALIDALVAQALDDLDEGRLDVESALRTIANVAWQLGRAAGRAGPDDDSAGT